MESRVVFEGHGPFDLPVAQQVHAEAQGSNSVSLSFRLLVDPSRLEVVRIAVLNNQALELLDQLQAAISNLGGAQDR